MTEYEIETALQNWLDGSDVGDVDADLRDFMSNVIDPISPDLSDDEYEEVEDFARTWIASRA
jgi:hypothetical protein